MQVVLPSELQPFEQFDAECMLLQSFGESHMKLGTEAELRSLISAQSVTDPQLLGFASTMLAQRAELVVMS